MTRLLSACVLASLFSLSALACSDDGNLGGAPEGDDTGTSSSSGSSPADPNAQKPLVEVTGPIQTNTTWSAANRYLMKSLVAVRSGSTLTIEKGTTILGDNATKAILLVEAGARIVAEGTADEPIVFTSQAPEGQKRAGDWGGLVVLGNAPVNVAGANVEGVVADAQGAKTTYGGDKADDDSGVLRYVRIEYSGVLLSQDNEINGVTFAGVGNGTRVDHVQVRQTLDDCFEFFGGTVDAKYLACQHNEDDGFDMDNGYRGRLQFLVLQQDPAHPGEDNGFEVDNDADGSGNLPLTSPQVFNATLCGKNTDVDQAQYGMLVRRNARGDYSNLMVLGFEAGLDVRDEATATGISATGRDALVVHGSQFFASVGQGVVNSIAYAEPVGGTKPNLDNDGEFDEAAWVAGPALQNSWTDPSVAGCFNAAAPVFGPATTASEGAITPPNDGFFDASAVYRGAFKDTNDTWATTGKWAVWSAN